MGFDKVSEGTKTMTEYDLAAALSELTDSVNQHKIHFAEKFTELSTDVKHLEQSNRDMIQKVDAVSKGQSECVARNSHKAVNARMKKIEKTQQDDRFHIESTLSKLRDDQTGNVDEVALKAVRLAKANGTNRNEKKLSFSGFGGYLLKSLPIILGAVLALGIYIGAGGDDEKAQEKTEKVSEQLEKFGSDVETLKKIVSRIIIKEKKGDYYNVTTMEDIEQ